MATIKSFCKLPWTRMKIHYNGDVSMCCHQSYFRLGNILEQDWQEIWFSPKADEIRKTTSQNQLHENCKKIECPFFYANLNNTQLFEINDNGYPSEIEFDLHASHCNFGGKKADPKNTCIMCPRSYPEVSNSLTTIKDNANAIVEKIKPILPHINSLAVMGLAEIFWQNKIFEIFDLLSFKEYSDKISFWANTNGSVFDTKSIEKFAEFVRKSVICFSIDAANEETYLKIRKNNVFDKVINNLKNWNRVRKNLNKLGDNHQLSIYNNINLLNVNEISDMVVMAKELEVDAIYLTLTHNVGNLKYLEPLVVNSKNWQVFKEAEKKAIKIGEQLNFNVHICRPFDAGFSEKLYNISF
jgi:radical SAM protein with 4Fe4S-binding SPASM domain